MIDEYDDPGPSDGDMPPDVAAVMGAVREARTRPSARARKPKDHTNELTEIDIAERVIQRFGDELRYCSALGGWHAWTGTHWGLDVLEHARECVKAVARDLASDALADGADDTLWQAAKRCASANGTGSVLDVMRSDPRVVFAPDQANTDPWSLNCTNGAVDLRTGVVTPHDRRRLVTRCAGGAFVPEAPAPRFDAFLAQIQPAHEVRAYLSRLFGYSAAGVVREHMLGVFWGSGANGKSVLADVVMHALGDYAKPGPSSLIVQNGSHAPHPTDVASCVGSRLVVVHETKRGAEFDASKVKLLTGGDKLTARHMREDFFTFSPSHKLLMLSNYKPEADATDAALWRRVQLVPFLYVVPEEQRDPTLAATIIAEEIAGVLSWIIAGCLEWQRAGLCPPAIVKEQTEAYRTAEDTIGAWIEERCTVTAGVTGMGGQLYESYQSWCKSNGAKPSRINDFAAELTGRGYASVKTRNGKKYAGIGVEQQDENRGFGYE